MFLHCCSRMSYDVVLMKWLTGLLALVSVTSAFSVRPIDGGRSSSEGQHPAIDVKEFYRRNEEPVVILSKNGRQRSFKAEENPSHKEDELVKEFHPEAEYRLSSRDWQQLISKRYSKLRNLEDARNLLSILRADKRTESSGIRHRDRNFLEEKKRKEVVVDERDDDLESPINQLETDYVHVARSTKDFVRDLRRPMTSSNGSLKAVIDALVIVDNELYRKALKRQQNNVSAAVNDIKTYYSYVITLVDLRYSEIRGSNFSIRVRMAGVFIAQEKADSPWSEKHVFVHKHSANLDPNIGLEKLHEWLKEKHDKLPKYDHAMGFTGYTLYDKKKEKPAAGMAYIGAICQVADGYACSIIQEDGGLASVSTATHELGHNIGAKHDGEEKNMTCNAKHNYIMAPRSSSDKEFRKNFFLFSPCTIQIFKSALSSGDIECLFDSAPDKITVLPGEVISLEDQCKDVFGQDSGFCDLGDAQSQDEVCTTLWCLKPGKSESCLTRSSLSPVLGHSCAEGKICKNGQCLNKTAVVDSLKEAGINIPSANRVSSASKPQHRPDTSTEKPVKTELGQPKCKEDTNSSYCRTHVRSRPDLCKRQDMASYCCFSCSFV